MKKKLILVAVAVACVALIILSRLWMLGSLPPGIHIDEVSFGYEAQSLYETGKDTWNQSWPLYFKGYGEYKAPGVIYSYLALIPFFGHINTTVTRLPAAISGLVTILLFYLTIQVMFKSLTKKQLLLATLVFAFSPWHFTMSRVYYETSAGLVWIALGIYLIARAIDSSRFKYWYLAIASMSMAGYYYASYRYISILILFFSYWVINGLSFDLKKIAKSIFLFVFVGIGWLPFVINSQGLARLNQFNTQGKFGDSLVVDEKRQFCYLSFNKSIEKSKICYVFWNKPALIAQSFLTTFTEFITPTQLFLKGGPDYGYEQDYGSFIYPLIIFYVFGILASFGKDRESKEKILIGIIIISGYLPATLTRELNIHRTMVGLYGVGLLLTYGYQVYLKETSKLNKRFAVIIHILLTLAAIFYVIQSQLDYFFVYTRDSQQQYMFSSDLTDVYSYIADNNLSDQYDIIHDLSTIMSPLYAGFYGDLTAEQIQATGDFTVPNDAGWSYLHVAGKYSAYRAGIDDLVCEYKDSSTRVLVITDPRPDYEQFAIYKSKSFNGTYTLREVYDLRDVIDYVDNSVGLSRKCPKR